MEPLDLTVKTHATPNTYIGKGKILRVQKKQNVPRISLAPNGLAGEIVVMYSSMDIDNPDKR